MRSDGFTLAEVLVALALVGITGALAARLLTQAAREIEGAELGLRAALLLSEWSGAEGAGGEGGPPPASRSIGRGRIAVETRPGGWVARYEPAPGSEIGPSAIPGAGGYREGRTWILSGE